MEKIIWKTEKRKIDDLIPYERNPRRLTEIQAKHLKESLVKFDLVEIPVIDIDNKILAGHMRLKTLQLLGRGNEEIDVRVPNRKLSDEEFKEYNLRSNKNTGEWDYEMLINDFEIIDLEKVGFSSTELDKFINLEEDEFDAQAEYDKITEPKTKPGDIYQLGEHRLMCGDSTKREDIEKLMDGQLADFIFTDPPYNVGYDYTITYVEGRARKNKFQIFNDSRSRDDFIEFLRQVFQNWLKNVCTFSKGLDYLYAEEPCYFGWKKGKKHFNHKKASDDFKNIITMDIGEFGELPNVWYENRDRSIDYQHPTQKPVRLAERAIKKHSNRGSIVLDLFGGSGSTLIACEQLERRCFINELDPKFCDVIVKRWEKLKGLEAITLNV